MSVILCPHRICLVKVARLFTVIRIVNVERVRVAFAAFGKKETRHIRVRLICFNGLGNRERLAEISAPG